MPFRLTWVNLTEVAMSDNCADLRKLNQDTFDAEAKKKIGNDDWDMFLRRVSADEFTIRRSNPTVPNQNREEMIDWIEKHPVADRHLLNDEVVSWCNEALGVVTCPVTMNDSEGKLRRYQNIKVFKKQSQGNWQCLYWQVTEAPAQ
jgi:hypothetical protein